MCTYFTRFLHHLRVTGRECPGHYLRRCTKVHKVLINKHVHKTEMYSTLYLLYITYRKHPCNRTAVFCKHLLCSDSSTISIVMRILTDCLFKLLQLFVRKIPAIVWLQAHCYYFIVTCKSFFDTLYTYLVH